MLRLSSVAMRVERDVFFAEPRLEPLRHRRTSLVVRLVSENRAGAVKLLRENQARELVLKCPGREPQLHRCAVKDFRGKPMGTPNEKRRITTDVSFTLQPLGEFLGCKRFSQR